VLLLASLGCERAIDRMIERTLDRAEVGLLDDGNLHIVLCGTGTPLATADRGQACTAILGAGEFVLVDAGPGAARGAELLGLPVAQLTAVVVTHFHQDHIGGLGEVISNTWALGRERKIEVYGPPGIERVVGGFVAAYAFDRDYHADPLELGLDPELYIPVVGTVNVDGPQSTLVFERNGLRISAFSVNHEPVLPAYGYRIDYRGRSVVVSGDTAKSENLARHAVGADVLIHEAMNKAMFPRIVAALERMGRLEQAAAYRRLPNYHSTPLEAAEVAAEAGVDTLVFTHLPPFPNFVAKRQMFRGVSDVFDGEVVVGEDGTRLSLEPRDPP
jgi:ribonuclease Z